MADQKFISVADIATKTRLPLGYLDDAIHVFSMHNELDRNEYCVTPNGLQITATGILQIINAFPLDVRSTLSDIIASPIPSALFADTNEQIQKLQSEIAALKWMISGAKESSTAERIVAGPQSLSDTVVEQAVPVTPTIPATSKKPAKLAKPVKLVKSAKTPKTIFTKDSSKLAAKLPASFAPLETPLQSVHKSHAAKEKHMGETAVMHNGLKATIIMWVSQTDITLRFEDGTIRPHMFYCAFQEGSVGLEGKTKVSSAALVDALFGKSKDGKYFIAPDGQRYATIAALCAAYGVNPASTMKLLKKNRWSFDEALQGKAIAEKMVKITPPKPKKKLSKKLQISDITDEQVLKQYAQDDPQLPALTDEEIAWSKRMLGLMRSDVFGKKTLSEIRTLVYNRMTDVYGIVLKQALREYLSDINLDNHTHITYYRVITQTPKLANLFESVLTDFATGVNPIQ